MITIKKFFKLSLACLCTWVYFLASGIQTNAEINVDPNKAVIDNADVLTQETENYITNISIALSDECGAQIGVYTVDYIGNTTMEDYAYEIFNAWGLGDSKEDNGVLLLLSIGDDDYYVTRGMGLETKLPISTLGSLLNDCLEPSWVDGDYDGGTLKTVEALADRLCDIYDVSINVSSDDSHNFNSDENYYKQSSVATGGRGLNVTLLVVILIISIISIAIAKNKENKKYINHRRPPRPPRPPRHHDYHDHHHDHHDYHHDHHHDYDHHDHRPPSGGHRPPSGPKPSRPSSVSRPSRPSGVSRSSRPSSASRPSRPSGGSFRAGGGASRGGGVGRHK